MSKRKVIGWAVLGLLGGVQFIRPSRNNDGNLPGSAFVQFYGVPDSVNRILQLACYDCQCINTCFRGYTNIQPLGWILANHVRKGKSNLNFSEFDRYPLSRQISKLKAIAGEIEDNEMPLKSYKLLHKKARLSAEEKYLIVSWMRNKADSISNIGR